MRINKNLIAATKFNPTKRSYQMSIQEICDKIDKNEITLPLYQRDLSWTSKKTIDLFNYQLFGKAPIAPLSINEIKETYIAVPQVRFLDRELVDESLLKVGQQSVVDGQQRLSTSYKAYINHDDFRNIILDVSRAKFIIVSETVKPSQIPVGILLNRDVSVLSKYLEERGLIQALYTVLIDVRSKLLGYNYTINIAEDLTEDEQKEWFEVLNNAGSRVSALQMSFSKLKIESFDIYTQYVNPFREKIQSYGFEELFSPFTTNVSYPVASLNPAYEVVARNKQHNLNYAPIPSDTKEEQITNLSIDKLVKIIEVSLIGLEDALQFIADNNLEIIVDRMDYILYLTGYFIFNPTDLTEDKKDNLTDWFQTVKFTNQSNGERRNIFDKLINLE